MKIKEMFDCLVTPLGVSISIKPNDLIEGTQNTGSMIFPYVYNEFSKLKGCITSEGELTIDKELTGYSTIELIKYYCTPATLPIIDIIQDKTNEVIGTSSHYEGFEITRLVQSLIINASKLNIGEKSLKKLFCQYNDEEVDFSPKIVNNTIEYYNDMPVFYGFKGDECSRKNVFKFLFDGVEEIIDELRNNLTSSSVTSNSDEENPYAQLINIGIGFTALVVSAGFGYLGYKLYKSHSAEHEKNTHPSSPELQIENNDLEVVIAGVSENIITENTNF